MVSLIKEEGQKEGKVKDRRREGGRKRRKEKIERGREEGEGKRKEGRPFD